MGKEGDHPERDDAAYREKDGTFLIDTARELFIELFGVPFEWAVGMSHLDSDVGKHWKDVLESINNQKIQKE